MGGWRGRMRERDRGDGRDETLANSQQRREIDT